MKKQILLLCILTPFINRAQMLSPVPASGYNLDAIAENTTALAHSGGAIDGSDYVMYSAAYGSLYSTGSGLPNTGLISNLTRTYQLQPYSQPNMLFLTAGQTNTLVLTTPASFAGLSMLLFSTEGSSAIDVTLHFTDNSTQAVTNISVPDWFGTGNVMISGFDRCNRTNGTPNYQTSQPNMFYHDFPVNCTNRSKLLAKVIIQNTGSNARVCVMALAGAALPVYSAQVNPVTCSGGKDGSASISVTGGLPPFSYTIGSTPPQYHANPANLPTGVYTYTAQDAALCPQTLSFSVTQSLQPQPPLSIQGTKTLICAGTTLTLTAGGAASYTWNTGIHTPAATVQPSSSVVYTVQGHTSQLCLRSGTYQITVNPLPQTGFSQQPAPFCNDGASYQFSVFPTGGNLSGPGLQGTVFHPALAGTGTHVILYTYTDNNNCANSASTSVQVFSLAAPSVSPGMALCAGSAAYQVTVDPAGGVFSGNVSGGSISTASAGVFPFTYSISSGPCVATTQSAYTIHPLPVISFSLAKTVYCTNHSDAALNAKPGTGSFTGSGVSNRFFRPWMAGVGTHTITYTYTDIKQCSSSKQVVVKVYDCTSIAENVAEGFSMYPNPAEENFQLRDERGRTFMVTDISGRLIAEIQTQAGTTVTVRLQDGLSGLFFITDETGRCVAKLLLR